MEYQKSKKDEIMTDKSKITIEVVDILEKGSCNYGHEVGQMFDYPADKGKMCTAALHSLYPYALGLQMGASFPWEDDPDVITVCCPDYKNPVVFRISREIIKETNE